MSIEEMDRQIEHYTKIINKKTDQLQNPNLGIDEKKTLESEMMNATRERTKWKIKKNNLFTTRHKK